MLRNIIGPSFDSKMAMSVFFSFLFENLSLPAERRRFLKSKRKQEDNLDQFLTQKRPEIGPMFDSTTCMCIYIYIYTYAYAVELKVGPR